MEGTRELVLKLQCRRAKDPTSGMVVGLLPSGPIPSPRGSRFLPGAARRPAGATVESDRIPAPLATLAGSTVFPDCDFCGPILQWGTWNYLRPSNIEARSEE